MTNQPNQLTKQTSDLTQNVCQIAPPNDQNINYGWIARQSPQSLHEPVEPEIRRPADYTSQLWGAWLARRSLGIWSDAVLDVIRGAAQRRVVLI